MRHSARNEKRELIALERQFIRASFVNARASPIRSLHFDHPRETTDIAIISRCANNPPSLSLSFSSLSSRLYMYPWS